MLNRRRRTISRARAFIALGLTLTGWLLGTPLPAKAAQNVSIGISARILNPPDAVTDLVASQVGFADGDVQLVWTAPANENGVGMDHYVIRFATYPASGPAQAESWWSSLAPSQRQVGPAYAAGVTEFATISGLTVGVTHYFGIKTIDLDGQISPIDARTGTAQQAKSLPVQSTGPPPVPGALNGTALSTGSISWSWLPSIGASFYTLNAYPGGALIAQTSLLSHTESGHTPNSPVSRTVRAANVNGLSNPTGSVTVHTLAAVPGAFTVTMLATDRVSFTWDAAGNPASTLYRIEKSPDNVNFSPLGPLANAPSLIDTGLTSLTSYYYRVRAINGDGVQTSTGPTLTVYTPSDTVAPRAPMGLKGTLSGQNQNFVLTWSASTVNENGSAVDDLAGYHVYRSTGIGAPATRLTPVPLNVTVFADQVNGQTFFYTVRAIDTHFNESSDSLYADSSPDANVIYVAADGVTNVRMPSAVNDLLRPAFNKYGVPLTVQLVEEPAAVEQRIIRDVRFLLLRGDTLEPVNDLSFQASAATVALGFNLIGGEVAPGVPVSAPPASLAGVTPNELSLYWSNGVSWIKLGGIIDLSAQTVSVHTSFLGHYQLRAAPRAGSLSLDKSNVYPRVFTPNGDGLNDRVYFVLENPNDAGVRGQIFDKDGRHVANLSDPSAIGGIGSTMIWDGRDTSGNVVPGGVYLYRIEGEGKTFTGTVGVAR